MSHSKFFFSRHKRIPSHSRTTRPFWAVHKQLHHRDSHMLMNCSSDLDLCGYTMPLLRLRKGCLAWDAGVVGDAFCLHPCWKTGRHWADVVRFVYTKREKAIEALSNPATDYYSGDKRIRTGTDPTTIKVTFKQKVARKREAILRKIAGSTPKLYYPTGQSICDFIQIYVPFRRWNQSRSCI